MTWLVSDPSYTMFLLVDFIAIFTLVAAMRWLSRIIIKPVDHHSEASNIETACGVIALMLALTGVTSGEFSLTLFDEWWLVTIYGLLAITLLRLGAWIQDKVVLPTLNLSSATQHGNITAAYITGAHLIGTAIVIRASMEWSSQDVNLGLNELLFGFVLSQFLLALETRLRLIWMSGSLLKANRASIIKAAMQHIGAALAISSSAHFASDLDTQWQLAVVAWFVSSIVFLIAYLALAELCVRIILPKDEAYEGGRAVLEGSIYLGWGFILPALAN
ncbi:MAG: uncharacterized membrane protein YjfL (UPF0719 family) [Oceanicoccus sp.]|jgi:uncharacterized membrane protein YjfL (UPF0719 family)